MIYDFLSFHNIFFQITYAITLTNAAFFIGKLITQNNDTTNLKMRLYQMKLEQLIYQKLQILETKMNVLLLKHNMIPKDDKEEEEIKNKKEDDDDDDEKDVTVSFMEQIDKNNIQHDYISQLLTSTTNDSQDYITIDPEEKNKNIKTNHLYDFYSTWYKSSL